MNENKEPMLEEDELLDENLEDKNPSYKQLRQWWEGKKRLRYNQIVGGTGTLIFLLLYMLITKGDQYGPKFSEAFLFFGVVALIYALAGNILYCFTWGARFLAKVYSKYVFRKTN